MTGMLIGLAIGKRFLRPTAADHMQQSRGGALSSPCLVYSLSTLLSTGCMFGASYLEAASFEHRFWVYAVLMGFLNGVFSGVAYQAPILAC